MNERKIHDYIQGRLSSTDRVLMEANIKKDHELSALVEEHRSVFLAIHASEQKELKQRFQKIENGRNRRSLYMKFSIAASIAIVLGIGGMVLFSNPSGPELFAENFEAYPNVVAPITRGNEPTKKENKYFIAYEKGEYSVAIAGFQEQLKVDKNHDVRFYLGMAFLNKGEKVKALVELERIDKEKTTFYPQVLWYSALIYIEKEDFVAASERLKELATLKTTYKKKRLKEILKDL